jgi:hypothetical protein
MTDSNHPTPEHSAEPAPITTTPKKKGRTTTKKPATPKKERTPRGKPHVPIAKVDPLNPSKLIYEVPIQHEPGKPKPAPAIIYTEDYERLYTEETCPRLWYGPQPGDKKLKYVTVKSKRRSTNNEKQNHVAVAWLILRLWPSDNIEVKYADDDRNNLRRDNLEQHPRDDNPHVQEARKAKAKAALDAATTTTEDF